MKTSKTVLHPQEIETFYIIPTLRRYFAIYLQETGMKQKDVAELLGINSATISQYRSNKRGNLVHFEPHIEAEIKLSALRIKSRLSYFKETQHILQLLRKHKILCEIHQQFSQVPTHCNLDKTGCILKSC